MTTGLLMLAGVLAAGYAALAALVYFGQESFIFYPRPNDPSLLRHWAQQQVAIRTKDGALEGWWAENPSTAGPVVLYFGGNAEDVLYTAATASQLHARRMLVTNYRGYGKTRGQPGQQELFADALAIYDYVVASGVRPEEIVVMGRSLGSGVAAMLASERPVRAAILVTPYDSLAAVAARHYSFLPTRWLLKHRFPSVEFARKTSAPALLLAAQGDRIIPPEHARHLQEAWRGDSEIHVLAGVGHNDIEQNPDYYPLVNRFLSRIVAQPAP